MPVRDLSKVQVRCRPYAASGGWSYGRDYVIITTGSLKSHKNGNPVMPIFMGCVYFYDTGCIFLDTLLT